MIKSIQLSGMRIVDSVSGKIIGKVRDIIYCPGSKKIGYFFINCGRWVKSKKAIEAGDIDIIGKDEIMVKGETRIIDIDKDINIKNTLEKKEKFAGMMVITGSGEEIGYVEDVILNEKSLEIEGYVLTDGVIEDIISGKTIIPFTSVSTYGVDAVIVNDYYNDMVLKNDISLKKYFEKSKRYEFK